MNRKSIFLPCLALAVIFVSLPRSLHAAPVEWPISQGGNGHFYGRVETEPITWHEANHRAQALSYKGMRGHLLTTTSQAELQFVQDHLLHPSAWDWIGGYQDRKAADYREPAGGWRWVTGEPFDFTAWSTPAVGGNDREPNDVGGIEDFMATEPSRFGGETIVRWNDFPDTMMLGGFYVEYDPRTVKRCDPARWGKFRGASVGRLLVHVRPRFLQRQHVRRQGCRRSMGRGRFQQ